MLVCFSYFPNITWGILAFAAWVLFLLILPKLCLALTEYGTWTYFYPFGCFWGHVAIVAALFAFNQPVLALPLIIVLALLWYFPVAVVSLFGVALLWLLFPLLQAMKIYLLKAIENNIQALNIVREWMESHIQQVQKGLSSIEERVGGHIQAMRDKQHHQRQEHQAKSA